MMDADGCQAFEGAELADWRALPPARRRAWWDQLWSGAIALAARYRLALRSGWWQDPIQVEALAAFCCWLRLYDTGAETDPTGKLQLLWELERLREVLRAGERPFDPKRDRAAFDRRLAAVGGGHPDAPAEAPDGPVRRAIESDLAAVHDRLGELREREQILGAELARDPQADQRDLRQAKTELGQLRAASNHLARREQDLRRAADHTDGDQ